VTPIERHKPGKAVLQFSGGKDSLACLLLLRPWWDRLTVMWVNTGAAFPETLELMEAVRSRVANSSLMSATMAVISRRVLSGKLACTYSCDRGW
jgi:3'-phosphoadenosine 5'-phosphosulfate sulfotransferase (PAPS reductase)/FAD synthetase